MAKTTLSLSTLTFVQKNLLGAEKIAELKALESTLSGAKLQEQVVAKLVSNAIMDALKIAASAEKKAGKAAERRADYEKSHVCFYLQNEDGELERNNLNKFIIIKNGNGTVVSVPSGHDSNSIVILRKSSKELSLKATLKELGLDVSKVDDVKTDIAIVHITKSSNTCKNRILVKNNASTVDAWLRSALVKCPTMDKLVEFLNSIKDKEGNCKFDTVDLAVLKSLAATDKSSERKYNKYLGYFTAKTC